MFDAASVVSFTTSKLLATGKCAMTNYLYKTCIRLNCEELPWRLALDRTRLEANSLERKFIWKRIFLPLYSLTQDWQVTTALTRLLINLKDSLVKSVHWNSSACIVDAAEQALCRFISRAWVQLTFLSFSLETISLSCCWSFPMDSQYRWMRRFESIDSCTHRNNLKLYRTDADHVQELKLVTR